MLLLSDVTICNVKFCRLVDYDVVAEYHRRQMNLENSWYSCMLQVNVKFGINGND
jgi:hypothetical protein